MSHFEIHRSDKNSFKHIAVLITTLFHQYQHSPGRSLFIYKKKMINSTLMDLSLVWLN